MKIVLCSVVWYETSTNRVDAKNSGQRHSLVMFVETGPRACIHTIIGMCKLHSVTRAYSITIREHESRLLVSAIEPSNSEIHEPARELGTVACPSSIPLFCRGFLVRPKLIPDRFPDVEIGQHNLPAVKRIEDVNI
jgi:hypothetical protein